MHNDITLNKIIDIINKNFELNVETILKEKKTYDNSLNINKAAVAIVANIENEAFNHLIIKKSFFPKKAIKDISELFVIGLKDITPEDFEGDEPLILSEMFETTAFYILESIKKNEIDGVLYSL